ncbi:helix-turn-helix domain-containing protein [Isoptericola sp. 4D.3]|jgi:AraC family transcriptional regulator, melibiose operon regulatory protein|uniref:Helix-turn-helix domain-containing protein n=1 Tax=Isoptericola peretonis TaxID=2918523 RepID=A0ABT0J5Z4_9MICO|nr:helix-turn-helix domain-containing protein [Isoptericola sp. 4D.3]
MTLMVDDILTEDAALWVRHGAPPVMEHPHRHDDLELNLVHSGQLEYLFGGSRLRVAAGEVAIFWGGTPHQLVDPHDPATAVSWVHIPLTEVLGWALPPEQIAVLLRDRPVVVPVAVLARDVDAMFATWHRDVLEDGESTVVMLETQAFVRRVLTAHDARSQAKGPDVPAEHAPSAQGPTGASARATAMAQFVAERYRSPITPSDVARAVHLSPSHAMTLFRRVVGTTVGTYIARCRVAEAQRLLITTSATTTEIAHAAGFASQSSFYETFRQICGMTPGGYRRALR